MRRIIAAICLLAACVSLHAENWPHWRGPAFNGSSPETGLPSTWRRGENGSKGENLLWTVSMPGGAVSTPIIWEDRVFVTSTEKGSTTLWGFCINRTDGKIIWKKSLATAKIKVASGNIKSSLASPSPTTDGKTVYFAFGTSDLIAMDFDGDELWRRNLESDFGTFSFLHGYGSSPLLYRSKLYVVVMRNPEEQIAGRGTGSGKKMDSFLLALDPKTGKDIWKVERPTDAVDGAEESYSSPIPWEDGRGKSQIVVSGANYVTGHDPETGKESWRWGTLQPGGKMPNKRIVVSPTCTPDLIYATGPNRRPVFAIKSGGSGVISETGTAWQWAEFPCSVPSPLLYDGNMFILDGQQAKRTFTCLDPKTGTKKWDGSLGAKAAPTAEGKPAVIVGDFSASPTGADGKIFCISEPGTVMILDAKKFDVLSLVQTGEGHCASSIAIAHQHLFIRTAQALYCVGK